MDRSEVEKSGSAIKAKSEDAKNSEKANVHPHSDSDVSWDMICVFMSLFTFVFDQVTDVVIAVYFWHREMHWYFCLALGFYVIPSVIITSLSLSWYIKDAKDGHGPPLNKLQWAIRIICIVVNGSIAFRYIELICYGVQTFRKRSETRSKYLHEFVYEDTDACLLRLVESFLESAPQAIIQLYILIMNEIEETDDYPIKTNLQLVSLSASLISFAWAIATYNRSLHLWTDGKRDVSWVATVVQFIWRLSDICSRVLPLAFFASVLSFYVIGVTLLNWLVMSSWVIFQRPHFYSRHNQEIAFDLVLGWAYMFCFLNLTEEPTRFKMAFYNFFYLFEGIGLMMTWYFLREEHEWYHLSALLTFFGLFLLGVLLMRGYYFLYHPTTNFRARELTADDLKDKSLQRKLESEKSSERNVRRLCRRQKIDLWSADNAI